MDDAAQESVAFAEEHIPQLYRYVVVVAHEERPGGPDSVGSGVLVRIKDRHFVATAEHCMRHHPRVIVTNKLLIDEQHKMWSASPLRIITKGSHDLLDIGFLEIDDPAIADPIQAELVQEQLCFKHVRGGQLHVMGHPVSMLERDSQGRIVGLSRCTISTTVVEQTEDCLTLNYPKEGVRFDPALGKMAPDQFPAPYGISGGPCFGVGKTLRAGIEVIEYNLLGIEYEWHDSKRWVKVVPIKQWWDLICEKCGIG